MDAQIEKLKASLFYGDSHCKKVCEDEAEECWDFETDRKFLQHKKDKRVDALKGLEEEVATS